ncbi:MAG: membrane dipeptidase [Thermoleophilaceae bacterium]|nr:membrane dipeptidase [Thermoleophilaceae bacterium]
MLHEGTYWKWIERAWRSGLRLMVNDLVENRALCELYPLKQNNCNEMVSAYKQAEDMHALQDYIDAQFGGPGKGFLRIVKTPAEARRVINAGKLAMVLGIEVSEVLDCGQFNGTPRCDTAQIDRELDRLHAIGVRSMFPVHKFDNALGGTHFDSGATGVLVNTGNRYVTGQFWAAEHCDAEDHDNTPTPIGNEQAQLIYSLLGPVLTQPLFQGQLPVYPPDPLCNPKGLSALGEYVIRSMMRRGMIVETDHMSVKARQQTLSILEAARYPGLISSHSWAISAPRSASSGWVAWLVPSRAWPRPSRTSGVWRARTATRATSSAPASAPTSTGSTPSPCRGRAQPRTRCATPSARSTAVASSTASTRARACTTSTPTASIITASTPTGSRTCAWWQAARSSMAWPTAPRRTCKCGRAPRRRPASPRAPARATRRARGAAPAHRSPRPGRGRARADVHAGGPPVELDRPQLDAGLFHSGGRGACQAGAVATAGPHTRVGREHVPADGREVAGDGLDLLVGAQAAGAGSREGHNGGMEGSAQESVGTQSSWLRCYRCWSQNLEVQLHYEGILKVDADTGEAIEPVEEVQEAVVQCLDCLHDQPHLALTFYEENGRRVSRVEPVEDRWERMVTGTPWVASCTVTVDADQVESCSGPEAAESLAFAAFGDHGTREFFTHVRFHKHEDERIVIHMLVELYARSADEATDVMETAARGALTITSLAEESRPPASTAEESH